MSVVVDKLSFVTRLEDRGGSSRPLSNAFHQAVSETVPTKQDLTSTRLELEKSLDVVKGDLQLLRSELKFEVGSIRSAIKAGLAETKVWTVSVGATIIAVLAAMKCFG